MKVALWLFGVIAGIVFKMVYDYMSDGDKIAVIIVAFFIVLVVALIEGIQSLPDKGDDKEKK